MISYYDTTSFSVTLGVYPGYATEDQLGVMGAEEYALRTAIRAWAAAMKAEHQHSAVLVTAVAGVTYAVYAASHGCPEDGEITVTFTGTRNPKFCPLEADYVGALLRIVEDVKKRLDQSRAMLTIYGHISSRESASRCVYFEND